MCQCHPTHSNKLKSLKVAKSKDENLVDGDGGNDGVELCGMVK